MNACETQTGRDLPPRPPLVLVADDDPDILEAVCEILETDGFRVARARHGREALERYEEERPALILLDLMMPVMSGRMFAHALQVHHPDEDVPIVVISADGTAIEAAALGARSFLPKPFDVDTLRSFVSDAID